MTPIETRGIYLIGSYCRLKHVASEPIDSRRIYLIYDLEFVIIKIGSRLISIELYFKFGDSTLI